jgi:FMN-dependent NADH-azoreductase
MKNIKVLLVTSSPKAISASSWVAKEALRAAGVGISAEFDTLLSPPPAYGKELMDTVFSASQDASALVALAVSDAYIEQLEKADVLVAAIPMHNFGVPSGFKAWMDQIARLGARSNMALPARRVCLGARRPW